MDISVIFLLDLLEIQLSIQLLEISDEILKLPLIFEFLASNILGLHLVEIYVMQSYFE